MRILRKVTHWLVGIVVLLAAGGVFIGWWLSVPQTSADKEKIAKSPQFTEGKFVNPERQAPFEITTSALKEALATHPRTTPGGPIPVVNFKEDHFEKPPASGLRLYWLGHASVLIEIDGKRILTDPVFAERASPFAFVGPKRFHPTPIPLENVSNIDAVVISHNHYDHLDAKTVRHLTGQGTIFHVPLGNKTLFLRWGVPEAQVKEMDWWQENEIGDLKIIATPTRHYSNRGTFDHKKTLWASWAIIGPENRVFFSGDTGYSKIFSEIGKRLGPFDATLIKVGAYGPSASWLDVHMTPEDAVRVHQDVVGKAMLPVHWGTFNLGYHPWDEPIIRSAKAADEASVELLTPKVGEVVDISGAFKSTDWWSDVD